MTSSSDAIRGSIESMLNDHGQLHESGVVNLLESFFRRETDLVLDKALEVRKARLGENNAGPQNGPITSEDMRLAVALVAGTGPADVTENIQAAAEVVNAQEIPQPSGDPDKCVDLDQPNVEDVSKQQPE